MEPLPGNQANVEYFFRLLYEWIYGPHGTFNYEAFKALLAHTWLWIVGIGYALSVVGMFFIVYATVQIFELRKREHEYYTTLIVSEKSGAAPNSRWNHIQSLVSGSTSSEWREAIIEADIMLDNILGQQGYEGESVSEKLKTASFGTIQDAWEAHKVRNEIAHRGSSFDLSDTVAKRTISRFEAVFREFGAI